MFLWVFASLWGGELSESYKFTRITPTHFQTRTWILYSEKSPALVILAGTVHMGEESYYQSILELLDSCDLVFYEDIQPVGILRHDLEFGNFFSFPIEGDPGYTTGIQMEYAKALGLIHQGSFLRPRKNWINADANWEEFQKMLKEFKERKLSLDKTRIDGDIAEVGEILREREKNPGKIMDYRRKIAHEISEQAIRIYTDQAYQPIFELFIERRNQIAMQKISLALQERKVIGMVYGAAHVPDFLERLRRDFGYRIVSTNWINAWRFQ